MKGSISCCFHLSKHFCCHRQKVCCKKVWQLPNHDFLASIDLLHSWLLPGRYRDYNQWSIWKLVSKWPTNCKTKEVHKHWWNFECNKNWNIWYSTVIWIWNRSCHFTKLRQQWKKRIVGRVLDWIHLAIQRILLYFWCQITKLEPNKCFHQRWFNTLHETKIRCKSFEVKILKHF